MGKDVWLHRKYIKHCKTKPINKSESKAYVVIIGKEYDALDPDL